MIPLGVICLASDQTFCVFQIEVAKARTCHQSSLNASNNSGSQEEDTSGFRFSNRKGGQAARVAAITAKLEDGNISTAARLLCSDDTPAEFTTANLGKLQDKHPIEHMGARIPPTPDNMPALQVSEDTVLKAIRSFPAGSAPGPDGIRPQHLLELVQSQEAGPGLFTAVTTFINSLLVGKCHDDYQHNLSRGKLIALDKKSSEIRPIVVGYTWRRLEDRSPFGLF